MYGTIFNIQSFSLHDGPGIRTTVFFKGCPLKCLWCHNPESHREAQELLFYTERCTGCGKCVRVCPEGGVTLIDGRAVTDRKKCIGCGHCVTVCPAGAREISGKMVTVEEVMEVIEKDRMFYESSGGGVTLSWSYAFRSFRGVMTGRIISGHPQILYVTGWIWGFRYTCCPITIWVRQRRNVWNGKKYRILKFRNRLIWNRLKNGWKNMI